MVIGAVVERVLELRGQDPQGAAGRAWDRVKVRSLHPFHLPPADGIRLQRWLAARW